MSSPDKVLLKAYVTPEEYAEITEVARKNSQSTSNFIKCACLGTPIKSKIDQKIVLDLLKLAADLGRIGGLLKLGLSEQKLDRIIGNNLLDSIRELKEKIEVKVDEL
jgi:hypothetical protein